MCIMAKYEGAVGRCPPWDAENPVIFSLAICFLRRPGAGYIKLQAQPHTYPPNEKGKETDGKKRRRKKETKLKKERKEKKRKMCICKILL